MVYLCPYIRMCMSEYSETEEYVGKWVKSAKEMAGKVKEMEHPLEFSIAMDAIMRTIAYSTDISEATINYAAKKENK